MSQLTEIQEIMLSFRDAQNVMQKNLIELNIVCQMFHAQSGSVCGTVNERISLIHRGRRSKRQWILECKVQRTEIVKGTFLSTPQNPQFRHFFPCQDRLLSSKYSFFSIILPRLDCMPYLQRYPKKCRFSATQAGFSSRSKSRLNNDFFHDF